MTDSSQSKRISLINPYKLLGVNPNSSVSELKKAYYQLSLLCHPDKGGNKEDMCVVHQSYKYIKNQLENANTTKTYDDLEQEFQDFCKSQEEETPPPFVSIFEEANDFIREFNRKFEEESLNNVIQQTVNPFEAGYGHLMEESEIQNNIETASKTEDKLEKPVKNAFTRDIMIYKEPEYIPNTYGNYHRFDKDTIDDFSETQGDIHMTDYSIAFSPPEKVEGIDIDKSDVNKLYEERLIMYSQK